MFVYILKRLLLMVPTLLGVLLMTFVIIQFVPGGPVEQMVARLEGRDAGGEVAQQSSNYRGRQAWTRRGWRRFRPCMVLINLPRSASGKC